MMYLKILVFIKVAQQILYFVYLLQLKEYRIDRLSEHLSRTSSSIIFRLINVSILAPISPSKLPKPTGKSIMYVVFSCVLLLLVSNFFFVFISMLIFSPLLVMITHMIFFPIEKSIRLRSYRRASEQIKMFKKDHGLVVIGITGSYGKTTTKNYISHILSKKFNVLSTKKSINTPYAISSVVLNELKPKHQFFIVEMGAYKKGEIDELCAITHPDIGVITGISDQHIALFGTQQNIIEGKSELLLSLPKNGTAYVNNTTEHEPMIPPDTNLNIVRYSMDSVPQKLKRELSILEIPEYLKVNIVPAILIAQKYDIETMLIEKGLENIDLIPGRMSVTKGRRGITIINDSYSTNKQGAMEALKELGRYPQKNKVVIMPCLIELGNNAHYVHEKIGKIIKDNQIKAIFTTKDFALDIKRGSLGWEGIVFATSPEKIIKTIDKIVSNDTIVLIEGRVPKRIIEYLM